MTRVRGVACSAAALVFSLLAAAWSGAEIEAPAEICSAPPSPDPALGISDARALAARSQAQSARDALEAGRFEDLGAQLEAAGEAAAGVSDARLRAHLLIHVGRTAALLAQRGPEGGSRQRLRAAESFRAAANASKGVDGRLRAYALGYLAELYEREGRSDEALELTRRALFAAQTTEAPDALYRLQWQIARLEGAAGHPEEALAAYRRAVSSLAALRSQTAFGSRGSEAAFRSEVAPVYTGLVDLLLRRAAAAPDADAKRQLLREARRVLEDLKAAELRDYFRDACLETRRRTAPGEVPGAVVIYPILLPDRIELIVSAGGDLESYSSPVDAGTLAEEVRVFRRLLEKRTTRQYRPHAEVLYDWLIRPIEPALAGEVEALVFVPDGALRTIPFAALYDREARAYLIEKYPVAITPGLSLTDPRSLDRRRVRLLAAGISEAVQGYPSLDYVPREIEAVHAFFGGERLMNEDFVVERFEGEMSERPFGIVHIASHGEFTADASESFLVAYDGKMSMDRLAELVAVTRFREDQPLELLTLSACQTAAGNEQAALGLAGVAVRAGARSALATLWSVNDQASTDLVTEFYAQLENHGVSRAEALRRAQVKLLQLHHYRHPSYWSPFLLINSWL
jgi:CHAT domain-containing protein